MFRLRALSLLALCLRLGATPASASGPPDERRLPALWKIVSRFDVPRAQVEAIGRKFGASLDAVENTVIQVGETTFRINVCSCRTEKDAAALEAGFVALHDNNPVFVSRRGRQVAETAGISARSIAEKARDVLAWGTDAPARWKVTFPVAPLVGGPDAGRQALFERLSAVDAGAAPGAALRDAAAAFTFGSRVTLRTLTAAGEPAAFSFDPAPSDRKDAGDAASFAFVGLTKRADIPVLKIEAVVPVRAFSPSDPRAPVDAAALTRATAAWPAEDPAFARLAAPLRTLPPLERIERVLALTRERIHTTREGRGTRYGAAAALARGHGHCWDFSDAYITLARAAGLPARQIGGWLADMGGHIWAEVFIENQGWIAVDPTTTWAGVSDRYVPLWQSEDGAGPDFVWWAPPKLERQ